MTSTSRGSMSEKGAKYFGLLDQALCNGNWSEIPELARKTEKHASGRKCFALTARSEAQIASASHRPTSAESSATSSIHGLGELVPKLEKAIQEEKRFAEDAFAARVCLAEVYWLREDAEKAVQALEDGGAAAKEGPGGHTAALGWLEVCEVKANLIRVAALESAGKEEDARQLYLEVCRKSAGSRTPELRKWTERLLAKACMSMSRNLSSPTLGALGDSLRCFHAWSDFWSRAPSASSRAPSSFAYLDIPRRPVWKAYYDLLSLILQYNLLYNPASTASSDLLVLPHNRMADEQYTAARRRQRAELKRVEATYESLLLDETQFPKASQTNTEVEEWVQQAMANWSIFCSSAWSDADVGEGGQQAVSRGVLDILYRAATKTFHSTSILRCLFSVHAALGEFELAIHAFDSYVELVDKAKARAAKSGKHELGFDSNDSVLLTAAEAVRILCRYGDREQGEKAVRVVKTIEAWLEIDKSKAQQDLDVNENAEKPREEEEVNEAALPNGVKRVDEHADDEKPKLQPTTLAAAYRAIGITQAHWARLTFETDSRSKLQTDALQNLRLAQRQNPNNIETAYTLALLLAETGEIGNATTTLKSVIATANASNPDDDDDDDDEDEISPTEISKIRQLVPLWHLLALCLSAKDDYEQAARMCTSAFEQFGEPVILFGDDSNRDSIDTSNTSSRSARGVVGQMDGFEKEGLVHVKMSQLALVELMEGAEAAVDVSYELLALYGRLFGNVELMKPISRPPPTAASATPSKLGGTLRSLAGSIRPRSARTSMERGASRQESGGDARPSSTSAGQRGGPGADGSSIGVPISITVTNEDGVPTEKPHHQHHHFPFKIRGQHGDWREYGNLKSSQSNSSMRKKRSTMGSERPLSTVNETPKPPAVSAAVFGEAEKTESRDGPASPEQPLGNVAHNAPHDAWPPPPGHKDQPPRQDVRLPAPHPSSRSAMVQPRLPSGQERQQKISLLVKIWLFIAGLYARADIFEDAAGAVAEAEKLVESFENEVGAEHANARRFFEKGWAGGKSVDGLWGDVWGAKGDLAASRAQPFAALRAYEQALQYYPDHPEAIIGLSNLLMDIYEQKLPAEEPKPLLSSTSSATGGPSAPIPPPPRPPMVSRSSATSTPKVEPPQQPLRLQDPTPAELNRLACRDRAYMLLSTLTRLGSGWDHSEAWLTLARSHELSNQVGKAKQALWWVVELEERRPMRPWTDVGAGGFTL